MTTTTTTATDLAIIEKLAIAKLTRATDLDGLLHANRRSLLLVDCSGSMEMEATIGITRMDALRMVVAELRAVHAVPVAAFGLHGEETVAVVDDIPEPQGDTPIGDAIRFGLVNDATHLVIVTDGEPSDPKDALDAAREFARVIDVVYVGGPGGFGADFARQLATLTGGTCTIDSMGKPKELAGRIQLMLGSGD